jgi:chromosomal replication initiation ATPase DnaA
MNTSVEVLGKEALEIAMAMLRNQYSESQLVCANATLNHIFKEIGGNKRELILNAHQAIKAEAKVIQDEIDLRVAAWEAKYTCNPVSR